MITVTELQEQARAAELHKRRQAERGARKATNVRGFEEGPAEGVPPGRPQPSNYQRPLLGADHAAPSPQSEGPRSNPMPGMPHYVLPGMPRTAAIPQHVIAKLHHGQPVRPIARRPENDHLQPVQFPVGHGAGRRQTPGRLRLPACP